MTVPDRLTGQRSAAATAAARSRHSCLNTGAPRGHIGDQSGWAMVRARRSVTPRTTASLIAQHHSRDHKHQRQDRARPVALQLSADRDALSRRPGTRSLRSSTSAAWPVIFLSST
jgi:hypothetical protein